MPRNVEITRNCPFRQLIRKDHAPLADALMIAMVVVVLDESLNVSFEVTGQVKVFQQDAILERLMPALSVDRILR